MWPFRKRNNRNIFRFYDGTKERAVDPLIPWRIMWEQKDIDWQVDLHAANEADWQAADRVLNAARSMFGVKEFNPATQEGLTQDETFALLGDFWEYLGKLKKKHSPLPTPLPPSDSTLYPDDSTTQQESDSSSMESESSDDEPSTPLKRSFKF